MNLRYALVWIFCVSAFVGAIAGEPEFVIKRKLPSKSKAVDTVQHSDSAVISTEEFQKLVDDRVAVKVSEQLTKLKAEQTAVEASKPIGCQCSKKCGRENCQCQNNDTDFWNCLGEIDLDVEGLAQAFQSKSQPADWHGRVKILAPTASWCVFCKSAKDDFAPWFSRTTDEEGNQVYEVSDNENAAIQFVDIDRNKEFLKDHGLTTIPAFILSVDGKDIRTWRSYPGRKVLYDALMEGIRSLKSQPNATALHLGTLPPPVLKAIRKFKEYAGPEGQYKGGNLIPKDEQPHESVKLRIPAKLEFRWFTDTEGFHIELPETKMITASLDYPMVRKVKPGVRSLIVSPDESTLTFILPSLPTSLSFTLAKE